ncbi:MAG: hypothetical protein ACRDRL_27380 [Sciscionella sp.]
MADIRTAMASAQTVDVLAVRGLGILGLNDSLLRAAVIRQRPTVRVSLLDPDSEAAARRTEEVGESLAAFTVGIRLSIARLREGGVKISPEIVLAAMRVYRAKGLV